MQNPFPFRCSRWPSGTRRLGAMLLHQQCWCWGKDILHASGNLLIGYGFKRHRPPADTPGSTCYKLFLGNGRFLSLFGFGLLFRQSDGHTVYLNRYSFRPAWAGEIPEDHLIWSPQSLAEFTVGFAAEERKRVAYLMVAALTQVAEYEAHILRQQGLPYRQSLFETWPVPVILPENVPQLWLGIAERLKRTASALSTQNK